MRHCKLCKEPLHEMTEWHGKWIGSSHCLNHMCRNYAKPVFFARGIKDEIPTMEEGNDKTPIHN